jgi:hypothetical protein
MADEQLVQQYITITKKLLAARKEHGGDLPDDDEEPLMAKLDTLWYQMTAEEQKEVQTTVIDVE